VKIWSISPNYEFKPEKVLQGHQRWVWDCAFSADSAYLVTGESSLEYYGALLMRHKHLLTIPRVYGRWLPGKRFDNTMAITKVRVFLRDKFPWLKRFSCGVLRAA
jgi:hypothetical protein